jgi:integrase
VARLYQREGSPFWWTWGTYADGSRWQKSTKVRHTHKREADERKHRQLAERRAFEIEAKLEGALRAPVGARLGTTVTAVFDSVIEARRREGKAQGTLDVYARAASHFCEVLGPDTDVHRVTLADCERYIDVRTSQGAKRSTIAQEFSKFGAALNYAHRHGRYTGNIKAIWPSAALRNAYKARERYLTREEYARLHAEIETYGRGDWLAGYVFTGARLRELPRIKAADINLERGTLRIRGTKTTGADRTIPIAATLRPVVERRLELCGEGPLWPEWTLGKPLVKACARIGIPRVSCNDLRRTFCSWLCQAGVHEVAVVRLMGHGSSRMVRAVYARFGADDLAAAVAKL